MALIVEGGLEIEFLLWITTEEDSEIIGPPGAPGEHLSETFDGKLHLLLQFSFLRYSYVLTLTDLMFALDLYSRGSCL
jgi:hypothetical protein